LLLSSSLPANRCYPVEEEQKKTVNSARRFFLITLAKLESGQLFLKTGICGFTSCQSRERGYKRTNNNYFFDVPLDTRACIRAYVYIHARTQAKTIN
jgi:hypothetical protein